ncbi:hypothetical protein AC1031_016841 [Aphanomyces cochlioides]|nr:hypothetical protein AC1031_016841 [Aphanomyces cochlioides]
MAKGIRSRGRPDVVKLSSESFIAEFRDAVKDKCDRQSDYLKGILSSELHVFKNKSAFDRKKKPLEEDSTIGKLGSSKAEAFIVVVPAHDLLAIQDAVEPPEQLQALLQMLEWRKPKRLCGSAGQDWTYQGSEVLVTTLVDPLVQHFKAWQIKNWDKQNHALNLVLSGPGTGKSRMLDEMKSLLCKAAELAEDEELISRMKTAFEFRVTFENGTAAIGSLIDSANPEFDISYRMLYQLAKERKDWPIFTFELKQYYSKLPLSIGMVIDVVAKLEKMDNVEDMTVILCVDGMQKLVNDGTKTCDFYRVLSAICRFLNSSRSFAVCVCSATVQKPLREALADSTQQRVFLLPVPLCGHEVVATRNWTEKQLVDDMGGHGRALEALQEVLLRYQGSLDQVDPATIVEDVYDMLRRKYGDVFDTPLFGNPTNCQEVLAAILSRRRYRVFEPIGRSGLTVDELRSFGMFRYTADERLECAFILLVMLMRQIPKKFGELHNFDEHVTRSLLVWQRFEHFVAFYRRVKSIAYCETPVPLSVFHAGARFGAIDGILIEEPNPRNVVEAIHQHDTKFIPEDSTCFTNRDGYVELEELNTIVINGTSAPTGDLFMRIQLVVGNDKVRCNEVIQCKLVQSKQKMNKATYDKEQTKGITGSSDVFLLITSGELTDQFALPPRCGIVSKGEFIQYFGPFASRAYRSLLEAPNINTASFNELKLIEGVGEANAIKIVQERAKRKFVCHEDAESRLNLKKKSKITEVLATLHYA